MEFSSLKPIGLETGLEFPAPRALPQGASFSEFMQRSLDVVANLDRVANTHVQAVAQGKAVEPHEVMLAVEQANLALDLLIEVRNRLLESYQELARTPI